jgi:hypothetical protein
MNKILANMMLSCKEKINVAQIDTLQEHKDAPAEFDSTTAGFFELLNFNLEAFAVDTTLSAEKQSGPIELSRQEITMQTIVEDLSEEMKREHEDEMRAGRGAPSIAFFDLAAMGTTGSLIYIGGIVAFFIIIFYVLSQKLFTKPVDFQKQKKTER